jgi:ribonuclease BN (tRNA processing enzyme)
MGEASENLIFLGTAGARVVVMKQILASGGLWLNLGETEILLDPGPGSLIQAIKRKLNPAKLKAIILSHKHLDHSADINVMIEAMTEGGFRRRGAVFAPRDALEDDPVIFHYLRDYPERIEILQEGKTYHLGDISFETPLRHHHGVETYGLLFHTEKHIISYITDSRFFDDLCIAYKGELLILNVVRLEAGGPYDHLSLPEAKQIIEKLKPRIAILTHFGMTMWRAKPWELAQKLSEETKVRVIAARDGMRFELAELDQR